jgi:hypothetical protein
MGRRNACHLKMSARSHQSAQRCVGFKEREIKRAVSAEKVNVWVNQECIRNAAGTFRARISLRGKMASIARRQFLQRTERIGNEAGGAELGPHDDPV